MFKLIVVNFCVLYSLFINNILADAVGTTNAVLCEGQTLNIICSPGELIEITKANYGRTDGTTCPHPQISNRNCKAPRSLIILRSACNGKTECDVRVTNDIFGDPCYGTYKYLFAEYKCIKTDSTEAPNLTKVDQHEVYVCEGNTLNLVCKNGKKMKIINANYGRTHGPIVCPHPEILTHNCRAVNSLHILQGKCDNLNKCSINAANTVFGDPCLGTYKYLAVKYECIPEDQHEVYVCEGNTLNLVCKNEKKMKIINANYGRTHGPIVCPHPEILTHNCRAVNSLHILQEKCDNLNKCSINAANTVFGDPCLGTYKYLAVKYECIPEVKCPPRISTTVDIICELDGIPQDCNNKVVEGTIATMKCKQYYTEIRRGYSTAVCSDGSWDVPLKQCIPECGDVIPKGSAFIVNGFTAKQGNFPWHIGIYRKEISDETPAYKCGGSIISVKVVVSAAHCFADDYGNVSPASEYFIAAGKFYSDYNSALDNPVFVQKKEVAKIEIPKNIYRGIQSSYAGDIAVIVVKKPFTPSILVKPVCMDWENEFEDEQLKSNNKGHVVGWGATQTKYISANYDLKQLIAPYIDRGQCFDVVPEDFRRFVTPDKFCAGFTNGSSVCNGDSGGGMVFEREETKRIKKFYLRGVVSAGPLKEGSCDIHQYGAYTKISTYLNFIRRVEALNRVT